MVARITLASVCAVAIPFYVRFVVAMCTECRFAWIGYLVRIEPTANEPSVVEIRHEDELSSRAA
jgi:hypothetical protein